MTKPFLTGLMVLFFSTVGHADGLGPCLKISEIGISQKVYSSPIVGGELEKKIQQCPGLKNAETIRFLFDEENVEGVLIGHSGGCIRWVRRVTMVNLMDLAEDEVCPAKNP